MLSRAARRRWWALVVFTGAVLGFAALSGGDPDSASAIVLPLLAGKELLGGAADAVSSLGGTIMKEVLEYLLKGFEAVISLDVIKWLTQIDLNIGSSLANLGGPMVVIGGFFLVVGLITSVGDSYREVVAGTDTAARVIGQAIFRVIGLALLMGSWFWLVPLAVEVANSMSAYVLDDRATEAAVEKSFRAQTIMSLNPLFALLVGLLLVFATLTLVVMKFVIVIMFAALYLGGPVLIGFAALPRVGNGPLTMALRGTLTLMVIPLAWVVVFAAWAGISAGVGENVEGVGDAVKALTGPALFLAGMVVLFGVTKKLLSMATFGTQLSVPGAGMLRVAATMALARGLGAAAGAAGGGKGGARGAENVPDPAQQPRKRGAIDAEASGGAAGANAGETPRGPNAAGQMRREVTVPPASEGERKTQLANQRAGDREFERKTAQDAASSPLRTRDGVTSGPDASPEDFKAAYARMEDRSLRESPSEEQVRDAGQTLGPAAASASAGIARTARQRNAGMPAAARQEHMDTMARKGGGVVWSGDDALRAHREQAWTTLGAADPEQVDRVLGHHYDQHEWVIPGTDPGGQVDHRGNRFAEEDLAKRPGGASGLV